MAKETPLREKRKNDQNGSMGKQMCTRSSPSSTSTTQETSGLRRSVRETPSKKPIASVSSTRKSERLEKQVPTPPSVARESERMEKKAVSALGRSDRGKNVSSSNSMGLRKSNRNSGTSSDIEQRKDRKEKSVEELTNGTTRRKARMTARAFRALFVPQAKKSEALANRKKNKDSDTNHVDDIGSSHSSAKDLGESFKQVGCEEFAERAVSCSAHSIQENGHVEEVNASADADELEVASTFTACGDNTDAEKVSAECPQAENSELSKLVVGETSMEKDADPTLKRKQSTDEVALDAPGAFSNTDDCILSVEGTVSSLSQCESCDHPEICHTSVKRQRVDHHCTMPGNCSCSAKPDKESDCMALLDRGVTGTAVGVGFQENNDQISQQDASIDCKSDFSRFAEYWVPVRLSDIQLEQYCLTLLSKRLFLSSLFKNDPVGALKDTLISVRKTCDHPYVVDHSLKYLLTKNLEKVKFLDVDIKASGKLQLLDAMLAEIRKRGSKAVVVYQKLDGGRSLIGDFLDDFMRERFGHDSYERVECDISSTKKQNALSKFNKESGRFVLLLETRACHPTIKLSSVEAIILLDSSWNPSNDLRALLKIKLDSESERTKIFRLYSTCTVEEKVLILARQNKTVDSRENLNPPSIHALLMWGATFLFDELENFHTNPILYSGVFSEQSVMGGVIHEFLSILSSKGVNVDKDKQPLILEANHCQGTYSTDSPLFGEEKVKLLDENNPNIFWTKLLEGKNPTWKYCSVPSQRNRKRPQYSMDSEKDPEVEYDSVPRKRKKVAGDISDLPARHDEEEACRKVHEGALEPPSLSAMQPSPRSVSGINDTSAGNGSLGLCSLGGNISEIPEAMLVGNDGLRRLQESQKCLHPDLKPEMAKLSKVLHLSEEVTRTVDELTEYVINNYHVCKEPTTTLQAFQIAMCWTAASLRKQKINHRESLALAKDHLTFGCSREEVEYIYSMLCCMKSVFLEHVQCLKLDCLSKDSKQSNNSTSSSQIRYDAVKNDIAKAIREFQKICSKQLTKLLAKHEEDKKRVEQNYTKKMREVENKKSLEAAVIRVHISTHNWGDRLKKLNSEYEGKFDELKCEKEKSLENLEQEHTAVQKELTDKEAQWIERIHDWAQEELLNCFLDKDSNNKRCGGIISSNTSKNVPDVAGACDTSGMDIEDCHEGLSGMDPLPKLQNTGGNTLDGGTQLDVAELVGSNHGQEEDVLLVTSSQHHLNNTITENRSDGLPPLTEPQILTTANCQEKVIALHSPFSEDQVPDGASSAADEGISSRVPITSHLGVNLENTASAVLPSSAEQASGSMAVLDQQNEEIFSPSEDSSVVHPVDAIESGGSAVLDQAVHNACPSPPSQTEQLTLRDASCGHGLSTNGECALPARNEGVSQDTETSVRCTETHVEFAHDALSQPPAGVTGDQAVHNSCPSPPSQTEQLTLGDASHGHGLSTDGECALPGRNEGVSQDAETLVMCTENHVELAREALARPPAVVTGDHQADLVFDFAPTLERQSEGICSPNQTSPVRESVLPTVDHSSADQNTCPPSSSAGNVETQNISEAAEPQVAESGWSSHRAEIAESSAQTGQLSSGDASLGHHLPMHAGCGHQLRNEGVSQNAEPSANHEAVVQLANTLDGGSMVNMLADASLPNSSMSQSVVQATPQIPIPYSDPFQYELERIRREVEKAEKIKNEETSQLKAERDRKIAEIVAQYDNKLREAETKCHDKTKELETNRSYIVVNKFLANAFKTKCLDSNTSVAPAALRDANSGIMQQAMQQSSQMRSQRPSTVPPCHLVTTMAPPLPTPSAVSPMPRFIGPPLNSSLYPMPHARPPPPIANRAPPSGTTPPSHGRVRAPAPHLQRFRPSSLPRETPTQHSLQNPPTTVQQPLLPAIQNALYSRVPRPATIERPSTISNRPVLAAELLMDRRGGSNPTAAASAMTRMLIQQEQQQQQQQQQHSSGNGAGVSGSPDVVCLSDDE